MLEKCDWGWTQVGSRGKARGTKESAGDPEVLVAELMNELEMTGDSLKDVLYLEPRYLALFEDAFLKWIPDRESMSGALKKYKASLALSAYRPLQRTFDSADTSKGPSGQPVDNDEQEEDVVNEEEEELRASAAAVTMTKNKHPAVYIPFAAHDKPSVRLKGNRIHITGEDGLDSRLREDGDKLLLDPSKDIWAMNALEKTKVLFAIQCRVEEASLERILEAKKEFSDAMDELQVLKDRQRIEILKRAKVVGMTITGAAIYAKWLREVGPAVIILEEAAEVLESSVLALLGPWVKRLILIGDHQQLRPSVDCYELVREKKLDISMMERLITNGFPYGSLNIQSRMRPEFASLLKDVYSDLQTNMAAVKANDFPKCIVSSMYFWKHQHMERAVPGSTSAQNPGEGDMVVALVQYYIAEGVEPSEVRIIIRSTFNL